jgi:hypothetical protein
MEKPALPERSEKSASPLVKLLIDLGPLLAFFVAYGAPAFIGRPGS